MSVRRTPLVAATAALVVLSACSSAGAGPMTASTLTAAVPSLTSPSPTGTSASDGAEPSVAPVTGSPASAEITAAVTAAMQRWAAADTPATSCAALSAALQKRIGDGSAADCTANVEKVFGGLVAHTVTVQGIVISRNQAVVRATLTPPGQDPDNYFFVGKNRTWELNSIGVRQ